MKGIVTVGLLILLAACSTPAMHCRGSLQPINTSAAAKSRSPQLGSGPADPRPSVPGSSGAAASTEVP